MNSIVVHYKELGLKGKNRPWFVRLLVRNIRTSLAGLGIPAVRVVMGRIEIDLGRSGNLDAVRERLRHVFGIAYFSYAGRAPLDVDGMAAAILSDLGDRHPASFRVSARRADKRYPLTSPQLEREVGGRIKEATGWTVDLSKPELTIRLDLMLDHSFYFFGKEPGAGGLPTGTGGRVACLLSGGIDSPVAAYRLMRRGCSVLLIHFHSYPILSRASLAGPRAGHRRSYRAGGVADARQPHDDRGGDDDGGAAAAGGDGQGRNHGAGGVAWHVSDFDHPRSGLLHAVHAEASGHQGDAESH